MMIKKEKEDVVHRVCFYGFGTLTAVMILQVFVLTILFLFWGIQQLWEKIL